MEESSFSRLQTMASYADSTRFEIEDALVRVAASDLLSEQTSISEIIIDLGLVKRAGSPDPLDGIDSLFLIRAGDAADADPSHLADLIAESIEHVGSSTIEIAEIGQLEKAWVGTATPGPKITAFFTPTSSGSHSALEEYAEEIRAEFGDTGARALFAEAEEDAPFAAALSIWFPNAPAADGAPGAFHEMLSKSELVEADSVAVYEATEHRIVPNPNIWESTTGLQRGDT